VVTKPSAGLEAAPAPEAVAAPPPEALLDGHLRSGPFLAGPGSFNFILYNSILGGVGGFGTQLISSNFDFNRGKEGMLIGTLLGAGIGFAASTWWQFNNWMDTPVGVFSAVNAGMAGMLAGGIMDAVSRDITALAWAAFIGAELGGWITAAVGGGEMKFADGLAMASAGGWTMAYSALILAMMAVSGGTPPTSKTWVDTLLITPGLGASAMTIALMQIRPSATQVIRADIFGASVGAVVLLISGLVVGFHNATPYALSMLTSAGAITAVSLFWEEAAERPVQASYAPRRHVSKKKPYNNPWW
jgi:hypothetical protein